MNTKYILVYKSVRRVGFKANARHVGLIVPQNHPLPTPLPPTQGGDRKVETGSGVTSLASDRNSLQAHRPV